MNKTFQILLLVALVLVVGLFLLSAFGLVTLFPVRTNTQEAGTSSEAGIANPASIHCKEQSYTLEMRTDEDGGQFGVCIFPDGSECEEWAFYRGECSPGSGE
jgi:putative hemolysin